MKLKIGRFIALTLSIILIISSSISASAYTGSAKLYYSASNAAPLTLSENAADVYSSAGFTSVVDYIAEQVMAFEDEIDISSYNIYTDDIMDVFQTLTYYHPELINLKNYYSYTYFSSKGTVAEFIPYYWFTEAEKDNYFIPFYSEMDRIVSQAEGMPDDFSKVLFVHDYLVSSCEYDTAVYNSSYQNDDVTIYNAYGCLVNKRCVCKGYSVAFKAIMDRLSIESDYVSSDSMNHVWNTVTIDGSTYHIDVTFDDPVEDVLGSVYHDNFLCTDEEISANHYYWTTSAEITSEPCEDNFWRDITSKICLSGDYMYYSDFDGTSYSHLEKRNINTGETEIIPSELTGSRWFVPNSNAYYVGCYSRIELIGDTIYYSVPNGISSIKTDGTCDTRLYTVSTDTAGNIYGFSIKDNNAYIQVSEKPSSNFEKMMLDVYIPSEEPDNPEPLIGDVNSDGLIDINDVTYIQKYLAGYMNTDGQALIDESDSVEFKIADFNGDGFIDINDATAVQRKLSGNS